MLRITVGSLSFRAQLEESLAPRSCVALRALLPLHGNLLQARWSGEAAWVPLGDLETGLGVENATSYPVPGQLLLYPGGYSETEILFAYGPTCFASKLGQLAGNHVATIVEGGEALPELGRRVVWEGVQAITIEAA